MPTQVDLLSSSLRLDVSSAASLTFDVLSSIFEYACKRNTRAPFSAERGEFYEGIDRCVRWCITATCRHWREVAVHTTSLWSRIDVLVGKSDFRPSISTLELEATNASERGTRVKIKYEARGPTNFPTNFLGMVAPICESLYVADLQVQKNSRAWSHVFMTGGDGSLERSPVHYPRLRALVIDIDHVVPREGNNIPLVDLSHSPNLQYLWMKNLGVPMKLAPSASLTRLYLHAIEGRDFVDDILLLQKHCSNLEVLRWGSRQIITSLPRPHPILRLSSLQHLGFWILSEPDLFDALLLMLHCPQLRTLTIARHFRIPFNHYPMLERLDLVHVLPDTDVIPLLRSVPSIQELIFFSAEPCSLDLVQILCQRDPRGHFILLPQLRGLTLRFDRVDYAKLILQARNSGYEEGPDVPFVLHIPLDESEDVDVVGIEKFRKEHRWSVDDEDVYGPANPLLLRNWPVLEPW